MKIGKFEVGTAVAMGLAGFLVAYFVSKKKIRTRCKATVKAKCSAVPVLGEQFCAEQAEEICKV